MTTLEHYDGLGNDFLILLDPDGTRPIDEELTRAWCQATGADGVIRATFTPGPVMELRNADGSRAETSGNGLRCLAKATVDAGLTPTQVWILTDVGPRYARVDGDDVVVNMGRVVVGGEQGSRRARVDVGNPHLVLLVDSLDGPAPVDDPTVNVEAVVVSGPDELTMRVWERGVGETRACGSGSVAVAAAAHGWGLVGPHVVVHNPGGALTVDLKPDGVLLSGPVRHVETIEVEP
jgi:diaminopimelate epimerase